MMKMTKNGTVNIAVTDAAKIILFVLYADTERMTVQDNSFGNMRAVYLFQKYLFTFCKNT